MLKFNGFILETLFCLNKEEEKIFSQHDPNDTTTKKNYKIKIKIKVKKWSFTL